MQTTSSNHAMPGRFELPFARVETHGTGRSLQTCIAGVCKLCRLSVIRIPTSYNSRNQCLLKRCRNILIAAMSMTRVWSSTQRYVFSLACLKTLSPARRIQQPAAVPHEQYLSMWTHLNAYHNCVGSKNITKTVITRKEQRTVCCSTMLCIHILSYIFVKNLGLPKLRVDACGHEARWNTCFNYSLVPWPSIVSYRLNFSLSCSKDGIVAILAPFETWSKYQIN